MENGPGIREKLQELEQVRQKTIAQLAFSHGTVQTELRRMLEKIESEITELRIRLNSKS